MIATLSPRDLVTTALLGTDRRPPPGGSPGEVTRALLDEAARRRAARRATGGLGRCRLPEQGPSEPGPSQPDPAPAAARALMDEILLRPGTLMVELWLRTAVAAGLTLAPQHWTPVLGLAARDPGLDRRLIGRALGERGVWFCAQNPAWARLSAGFTDPSGVPPDRAPAPRVDVDLAVLRSDPDAVFAQADPWPEPTVLAVLTLLGEGSLGWRQSAPYAVAVGSRLPLERYPQLEAAARFFLRDPRAPAVRAGASGGTALWLARDALAKLEDTMWLRFLLARAFDPTTEVPARVEIPRA